MRGKGRVQSVERVHHAQAVRANQPHGTALHALKNLSLQLLSRFAVLFEASRDDNRSPDPRRYTFFDNGRNSGRRSDYHRQINLFRNLRHAAIGFDPKNTLPLFANRINRAAKGAAGRGLSAGHKTGSLLLDYNRLSVTHDKPAGRGPAIQNKATVGARQLCPWVKQVLWSTILPHPDIAN